MSRNRRLPAWWEVELELITQKKFFDVEPIAIRAAEYPFDVAIIYPAVTGARQLERRDLTKSVLPKGVAINTVKAALDLTGDGKPDVVIVDYCCGDSQKPADWCDYTCGKTFKKNRKYVEAR